MTAPRAVFTITAGRTGTHYLSALFACVRGARARHEDLPIGVGPAMQAFNHGDEGPMRAVARLKAERALRGAGPYLEANHAFVKGYGWLLPELLPAGSFAVLHLRRDPAQVAQSLLRVRGVPGKSWWSRLWYLSPGAARNLGEPAAGASDRELALWYAEEVERRALAYRERFPEVPVHAVTLEQLNDYAWVHELFCAKLELEVDEPRLREAVGRHEPDLNREFCEPPDLSELDLGDPDALPPAARAELLERLRVALLAEAGPELSRLEPGLIGETVLLPAVRAVTSRAQTLSERFGVALPQSELEMDLILSLALAVRPLDPTLLLFTRLPDGSYTLPALNSDGGLAAVLPVLVGNAWRRSPLLRAGALGAGLLTLAALAAWAARGLA